MGSAHSKAFCFFLMGFFYFCCPSGSACGAVTPQSHLSNAEREEPGKNSSPLAFVHINVIPMDAERLLPDHTVLVQGDRIFGLGPSASTLISDGATVIDGSGFFLLPGLTDAHVHLDKEIGARPDFGDAPLFLAHGVTRVFNLRGEPRHLDWKKRIQEGELLAPNLYNAGEFVNEPRVKTAALGLAAPLVRWVSFAWRGSDWAMNRVARDLKEAGVWMQSTLVLYETGMGVRDGFRYEQRIADPAFRCLPAPLQEQWKEIRSRIRTP